MQSIFFVLGCKNRLSNSHYLSFGQMLHFFCFYFCLWMILAVNSKLTWQVGHRFETGLKLQLDKPIACPSIHRRTEWPDVCCLMSYSLYVCLIPITRSERNCSFICFHAYKSERQLEAGRRRREWKRMRMSLSLSRSKILNCTSRARGSGHEVWVEAATRIERRPLQPWHSSDYHSSPSFDTGTWCTLFSLVLWYFLLFSSRLGYAGRRRTFFRQILFGL